MNSIARLVREQPYRLFFPLGVSAGITGVLMWPAWYGGWIKLYPAEAHARIMIECFMGAFMVGFIGTAFPRLTGNRPFFAPELAALLGLWMLALAAQLSGRLATGDAAFAVMLGVLLAGMMSRWVFGRRDTPPPGFILAIAGIVGGIAGAAVLAWDPAPTPARLQWSRLCLFQGTMLLPLMGIGPYLLPRFFGMPSSHSFDDSIHPPAGWWRRVMSAAVFGLAVIATFALEVHGHPTAAQLLRAALVLAWFALESPVLHRFKPATTPATAVYWALHGIAAGLICAALWPATRVGSLHLFYASGLGLVTLAVGARVVLGHAGRHDLLSGKIRWLRWVVGLFLLAALTRMTADFIPKVRISHQIYAAYTLAVAGILWLVALARFFLQTDDPAPPKCPKKRQKQ